MAYRGGDEIDRPAGRSWAALTAAPSIVPGAHPAHQLPPRSLRPGPAALPRCPEIDCVRHLLPAGILAFAELRAAELGVGADRVLVAQGLIDEETYLAALARWLGVAFEPLEGRPRAACLADDHGLIEAVN